MTIYRTAYDTTAGQAALMQKVNAGIRDALVRDFLKYSGLETKPVDDISTIFVTGGGSEDNIPYFAHPYYVLDNTNPKQLKEYLVSDVRMSVFKAETKFTNRNDYSSIKVRNKTEYDLVVSRAIINNIWINSRPGILRDISPVPGSLYCRWISDCISRRYALDGKDALGLMVLAGIFYQSLFVEKPNFKDEEYVLRLTKVLMRYTRAPSDMITGYIDRIDKLDNIKDFCRICRDLLENPRLQDFNEGILVTVVGNTWFGNNAKELMYVALEHPPTWITICFFAFTERGYKNSAIAKAAKLFLGNKGETDFCKAFSSLYRAYRESDRITTVDSY